MSTATLTSVRLTAAARPAARPVRPRRAPGRPSAQPALVLTPRGRRAARVLVLGAVTAVLAVALVLAWVTVAATVAPGASAGDGRAGVSTGAGAPVETRTLSVVVAPGDTLWQLAQEHAPDRDPRSVVADVVALNELGSAGVRAGQTLLMPVG